MQAGNTGWQTNLHGTQGDVQGNEFMHVSVRVYVSDLRFLHWTQTRTPNPTEQNSCPQHQLPEEILSQEFWFPSSGQGISCVGKFKSVHPI